VHVLRSSEQSAGGVGHQSNEQPPNLLRSVERYFRSPVAVAAAVLMVCLCLCLYLCLCACTSPSTQTINAMDGGRSRGPVAICTWATGRSRSGPGRKTVLPSCCSRLCVCSCEPMLACTCSYFVPIGFFFFLCASACNPTRGGDIHLASLVVSAASTPGRTAASTTASGSMTSDTGSAYPPIQVLSQSDRDRYR
jgi:hypothetical protein